MDHEHDPTYLLLLTQTHMWTRTHTNTRISNTHLSQHFISWSGWQPEDPYLPMNLLWKMTESSKNLAEVGFWVVCVCVYRGVTVIRIRLWLTRWARRSLKSQGSRLRRPPSNTSPHFTGPTSFYYWTRPLFFSLPLPLFWGLSERWKIACSWLSTSFPLSGSTVHYADRDPHTSINMSLAALTQVALLHHWAAITPTFVWISCHYIPHSQQHKSLIVLVITDSCKIYVIMIRWSSFQRCLGWNICHFVEFLSLFHSEIMLKLAPSSLLILWTIC